MTAKTKSIAIVIGTLIVGIIIGALATGAIVSQRVAEFQALRSDFGLARFLERVIEPTDEAQREEIRDVLDDVAERQIEIRRSIASQHREMFEDMREDLSLILTPEQKQELRNWMERDRTRRPGPPPDFGRPGRARFGSPFDSTRMRKPAFRRRFERGRMDSTRLDSVASQMMRVEPLPVDSVEN